MSSIADLLQTPADFINVDIFTLLGLQGVSQQKKDDLLEVMLYTVTNRVIARILDVLDEPKQKELELLLDETGGDRLVSFFADNGIDYSELFSQESLVYKAEMANLVSDPAKGKAFLEA